MRLTRSALVAVAVLVATALVPATSSAEPATTVSYPPDASTTRLTGNAFDTCNAPSVAAMQAWTASPYDGVGIYIGGNNRFCAAQPNLTSSWVSAVSKMPWRLIPIYLGNQAPCNTTKPNKISRTLSTAASQGTSAANDAVARASALHIRPGSALYYDMEAYAQNDAGCTRSVLTFLSAWTKRLHAKGYVSGVYANLNLGAKQISDAYHSTSYARPDALWIARYDNNPSLQGWTLVNGTSIPDSRWSKGQRGKQYTNSHNETWGGVTIEIDNNRFDGPVATVPRTYTVTTVSTPLSARTGPGYSYPPTKSYPTGSTVNLRCQIAGQQVKTSAVWGKLHDGTYVPDYYVSTPSSTTFSEPLPRCLLPYQTTATAYQRSGPGNEFSHVGTLLTGALARVECQATGGLYETTRVWNKLDDGSWVTDRRVATPSSTTFSKPIPRCQ